MVGTRISSEKKEQVEIVILMANYKKSSYFASMIYFHLLTGKKKWGMMFCVVFVAFIIIVPLLTVTLYNFISCYQASKVTNSNLGKA